MVLNNMYKNKYNTVQSRYVLDMMFGKSSGFLLIAFITYAYAKCIIQCIPISSMFVFNQQITYKLLYFVGAFDNINVSNLISSNMEFNEWWLFHSRHDSILHNISSVANLCKHVVSLWLYPLVNFIFRQLGVPIFFCKCEIITALFCQRVEQILHGFDM